MKFVKNMKIRSKLSGAFILLLMLMLLIGGLAIKQLGGTDELSDVIQNKTIPSIVMAGKMDTLLQKKRLLVMKFIAVRSADEIANLSAESDKLDEQMRQLWQRYEPLADSSKEHEEFQSFQDHYQQYAAMIREQLVPLMQAGKKEAAYNLIPTFKSHAEGASSSIEQLILFNEQNVQQQTEELLTNNQQAITTISLTLLISLATGALLSWLISSLIVPPLLDLVDKAQQVAYGHLDVKVTIHSQDEVGQMGQAFATMVSQLRGTIQKLAENALLLASASGQMQKSSEQIASSSEEVVAQAITVATAGEELVATTADIANSCHAAASNSEASKSTTLSGMEVVKAAVHGIRERSAKTKVDAQSVNALGKRTEQIGSIVATIQNIAAQTNLLALNAAIEAARAGEQGRGFAVVADEVRALAGRTTQATQEIGEMIGTIQQEARNATQAMDLSVADMEHVAEDAQKLEGTLEAILNLVNEVNMQITQIATAAEQQSATTAEISSNMSQITEVVQEMSHGAEESAEGANQLATMADEMKRTVASFHL